SAGGAIPPSLGPSLTCGGARERLSREGLAGTDHATAAERGPAMGGKRLWIRLAVVAAVAAAALEAAGSAAALGAPGTFTMTLLPGSLLPGGTAVVQATFTN